MENYLIEDWFFICVCKCVFILNLNKKWVSKRLYLYKKNNRIKSTRMYLNIK